MIVQWDFLLWRDFAANVLGVLNLLLHSIFSTLRLTSFGWEWEHSRLIFVPSPVRTEWTMLSVWKWVCVDTKTFGFVMRCTKTIWFKVYLRLHKSIWTFNVSAHPKHIHTLSDWIFSTSVVSLFALREKSSSHFLLQDENFDLFLCFSFLARAEEWTYTIFSNMRNSCDNKRKTLLTQRLSP